MIDEEHIAEYEEFQSDKESLVFNLGLAIAYTSQLKDSYYLSDQPTQDALSGLKKALERALDRSRNLTDSGTTTTPRKRSSQARNRSVEQRPFPPKRAGNADSRMNEKSWNRINRLNLKDMAVNEVEDELGHELSVRNIEDIATQYNLVAVRKFTSRTRRLTFSDTLLDKSSTEEKLDALRKLDSKDEIHNTSSDDLASKLRVSYLSSEMEEELESLGYRSEYRDHMTLVKEPITEYDISEDGSISILTLTDSFGFPIEGEVIERIKYFVDKDHKGNPDRGGFMILDAAVTSIQ